MTKAIGNKLSWRERYGHLPWNRRYEFLIPAILITVAYFAFFLPASKRAGVGGWLLVSLFSAFYIFCVISILSDREKSLWFKNIAAIGILVLAPYLFFHFASVRWQTLGSYFFNIPIMSKGDPLAAGKTASNWQLMFVGVVNTLKLFVLSAVFSTLIGLVVAVVRSIVRDRVLNFFLIIYVDVMRSMPILVMLVVVYSVLPYTGILLNPLASGVLTLAIVEGAYISEVFRAGIEAIAHTQIEAASSLGLTPFQTMRFVVLPQAFRIVIPPYTGYLVGLMKGTALCSQIAIFELLKSAYQIQAWYLNATPLILAAVFYLIILIPLTRLSNALEVRWKTSARQT